MATVVICRTECKVDLDNSSRRLYCLSRVMIEKGPNPHEIHRGLIIPKWHVNRSFVAICKSRIISLFVPSGLATTKKMCPQLGGMTSIMWIETKEIKSFK